MQRYAKTQTRLTVVRRWTNVLVSTCQLYSVFFSTEIIVLLCDLLNSWMFLDSVRNFSMIFNPIQLRSHWYPPIGVHQSHKSKLIIAFNFRLVRSAEYNKRPHRGNGSSDFFTVHLRGVCESKACFGCAGLQMNAYAFCSVAYNVSGAHPKCWRSTWRYYI